MVNIFSAKVNMLNFPRRCVSAGVFFCFIALSYGYVMTENQIKEDIKFLSQTVDGVKPSRLRALLLADLRRALPTLLPSETANCTSDADLKVTSSRCTCADYVSRHCVSSLAAGQSPPSSVPNSPMFAAMSMSSNYGKRSRIQRSCEDYCCRRLASAGRQSISATSEEDAEATKRASTDAKAQCEFDKIYLKAFGIGNKTLSLPPKLLPGLVQVFAGKSKSPICLGTLIHPQIVLTTMVCASSVPMNDRFRIKVRETVDRYQYRYQVRNVSKRILPNDYADLFQKFGFNVALLVLNKEVDLNSQTQPTCLAKKSLGVDAANQQIASTCFVESLENRNGRIIERREEVNIMTIEHCQQIYKNQNRTSMFFPKSNLCAGSPNALDIDITQNGAPLICLYPTAHGVRYVQHGMLSWSTEINRSPHLFANISNFNSWIGFHIISLGLI